MNIFRSFYVALALFLLHIHVAAAPSGTIRMLRAESFNASKRQPTIWLDQGPPVDLQLNQPIELQVEPGSHTLTIATRVPSDPSVFMQRRQEKIEVASGEVVHIEITWKAGLFIGDHEMKLTREVPPRVEQTVAQRIDSSQLQEDRVDAANNTLQTIAGGESYNGTRNERSILKFPNGNRYDGMLVNGKLSGKGTYSWADGGRYEGDFLDDKRSGRGVQTWSDGRRYEGDFANGEANGKGIFNFPNGSRYEGGFVDGKKSGNGVFILADGTRHAGLFRDDQLVGSKHSPSKAPESVAGNGSDTANPWAQFLGAALGVYVGTRLMQGGGVQAPTPSIDANSLQMNCDTRRTTMGANIGMNQSYQVNCR